MENNDFASAPLITPERAECGDLKTIFARRPGWAALGELACGGLPPEDDVFVVRVGDKWPADFFLSAMSTIVLFEATRFPGFGVTTNLNGRPNSPAAMPYLKLTCGDGDNITVSRIVMDAGPHQLVRLGEDRRDQRPHELSKGAGRTPASKTARNVLLGYAEEAALRYGLDLGTVAAYLNNLKALLAYHDDKLGLVEERY